MKTMKNETFRLVPPSRGAFFFFGAFFLGADAARRFFCPTSSKSESEPDAARFLEP